MSQPSDFGFTEEAAMLKESSRRFFEDKLPGHALHRLVAGEYGPKRSLTAKWDRAMWRDIVALGWPSIAIPGRLGGSGMPVVAVAGLVEEAGRAALPSPLLSTLSAIYAVACCNTDNAEGFLAQLARGDSCTLAVASQHDSWQPGKASVTVSRTNDGYALNGTAWYVQDAQKSDWLIVNALGSEGVGLYAISTRSQDVHITPDPIFDLTRDQARVEFNNASIPLSAQLAADGKGGDALLAATPALLTLLAADMAGAAEWQLQATVEYARTRVQFDRPIGFFQAVKHPLVDLMIMIDAARALVYNAACAIDHEPEKAHLYAHMAKASANDMAGFASRKSIQLHGGIGFTWECFVHVYAKRQKHSALMFGNADYHRDRMAEIVLG